MCVTPSINAGPESNFKPLTFTILNNSRILKNFYKVLMDLAALEFAFDQDNFDILEAFVSYKNQIFFGFKHQLHDVFRIIPEEKNFEYQNKLVDFFQGFALKMVIKLSLLAHNMQKEIFKIFVNNRVYRFLSNFYSKFGPLLICLL